MKCSLSLLVALSIVTVPAVASAATYTWVGPLPCTSDCPSGGDWTVAANWTPSSGVPGANDIAIINGTAVAGQTTTLANVPAAVAGLTTTGNTVLQIATTLTIASGTVSLSGAIQGNLSLGAGVTASLGALDVSGVELDNAGVVNWNAGTIYGDNGTIIRNSGTWNMTAGPTAFSYIAGTDTADFYNTGTINVAGTGNTNDSTGYWGFHNSHILNFTAGGTLEFQSPGNTYSTLDDGGSITGTGTLLLDLSGGFSGPAGVVFTGTTTITGATLQVGAGAEVLLGTTGATFAGTGNFLWTGGHIGGNGTDNTGPALTWANGLAVHLTTSTAKDLSGAYIINDTNVLWDAGLFGIGDDAYFTNASGATFTAAGDLAIDDGPEATDGYSTFENRGTFVKSAGSGALTVNGMSFTNYGLINGTSGSIKLVTVGRGPTLLETGSTLQGSVIAYGEVSLAGTSTVAASSTFEVGNDGMGDLGVLDGNGSIGGAGTVKLDGCQVNASMPSSITFAAGGNVLLSPNAATTTFSIDSSPSTLTFAGTTTWTGAALEIESGNLTNSGALTATKAGVLSVNSSGSSFSNSGTITAAPGTGIVNLAVLVTSSGTFVAQSGTLLFSGYGRPNYTQTAGKTVLAGGILASNDGSTPPDYFGIDIQGGTLSGTGTLDTPVSNEGTVAPGGTSSGKLTITQTYTQSSAGVLAIGLGGPQPITGYDVLAVGGAATVAGTLNVALLPGYLPSLGTSYTVVTTGDIGPDAGNQEMGTFGTVNDPSNVMLTTTYEPNAIILDVSNVTAMPDAGADASLAIDAGLPPDASSGDAGTPGKDASVTADSGSAPPVHVDGGSDGGATESGSSGGCTAAGTGSTGDLWMASLGVLAVVTLRRSRTRGKRA